MDFKIIRESERAVRLQKRDIRGIPNYSITIPRKFIDEVLKWDPKTELKAAIVEAEIGNKVIKGVLFYRPES